MDKLEKLTIKLCEQLPFNWTFFENNGYCEKPSEICDYCRDENNKYHCYKKTYTSDINFSSYQR